MFIAYSNKKDGNMDERFGTEGTAHQNRANLFNKMHLQDKTIVHMQTLGTNNFVDLNYQNPPQKSKTIITDGLITSKPTHTLALYPADCIPMVIYHPSSPLIALIHLGRRNISAGFHLQVIEYIRKQYKVIPEQLIFYLGPSIKQRSYYFDSIDATQKNDTKWEKHINIINGKFHINLISFVKADLLKSGILPTNTYVSSVDTGAESGYYSHRRSATTGESEGRNGFIVAINN